jgi:autotransporter-associated beta strand protein
VDGGLTKIGAGTLTLSATNTYTGPTVVSNGTLRLTTESCLTTNTAVTVASGAFLNLDFAGTNTVRSLQVGDRLLTRGSVYDKNHPAVSGYIITGNGYIKTLEGSPSGTLISFF